MSRRLVAAALSAQDVLNPGSDLLRVTGTAAEVDVLIARVDTPDIRGQLPVDTPDYRDTGHADTSVDEPGSGSTVPPPPAGSVPGPAQVRSANVRLHRLDLRWRVQDADEPDLVAALSELIGFDPDDGVFCVAPVTGPDGTEASVLARAVRRVARVYGLPVLHYHSPGDAGRLLPPIVQPAPTGCARDVTRPSPAGHAGDGPVGPRGVS